MYYAFDANNKKIAATEAARKLFAEQQEIERKVLAATAELVGLTIYQVLDHLPKGSRLKFDLTSSPEYNDEGGTFMSRNLSLSCEDEHGGAVEIDGVLPEDLVDELQYEDFPSDLAKALDSEDASFAVNASLRECLAKSDGSVDGLEVFEKIFGKDFPWAVRRIMKAAGRVQE